MGNEKDTERFLTCRYYIRGRWHDHCGHPARKRCGVMKPMKPHCIEHPTYGGHECEYIDIDET
jgi:hypothetical protein